MTNKIKIEIHDLQNKVKQQQARIAELESEALGFDDVLKLTECLIFLGCSTPESKEEAAAKWKTLVRDLIRVVKRSEIVFYAAHSAQGYKSDQDLDGFVLVPVEPTTSMIEAWDDAFDTAVFTPNKQQNSAWEAAYKAMIKAALEV